MKKYISACILLLSIACIPACKKYKAPYSIIGVTYEFTDLNDCTFEDSGKTGSSITLVLNCDDFITGDIYGVQYKRNWSNGERDKEFTLLRSIDLIAQEKNVYTYRCIRFAETQWIEYTIQIIMNNGDVSKPYTFRVDKPAGAQ